MLYKTTNDCSELHKICTCQRVQDRLRGPEDDGCVHEGILMSYLYIYTIGRYVSIIKLTK